MSNYVPDKWLIIKITDQNGGYYYRVFGSWYGGWAGSDSWKLNSGITKATIEGYVYAFEGSSGSVYQCHKETYGTNMYGNLVLQNMIENAKNNSITIEVLSEDTNFLELNYE